MENNTDSLALVPSVPEPGRTPIDLLHAAIEKGVDPAGIETLARVMLDMQARQAEQAFNVALAQFQAGCPVVMKKKSIAFPTKSGGSFTSRYAEMSSIVEEVRELLTNCGFSYSFDREVDEKTVKVWCVLRHAAGHQTRTPFSVPLDKGNKLSDAHAVAGAVTFCERYSFRGALGITTGDPDNDGKEFVVKYITADQVKRLEALLKEANPQMDAFWKYTGVSTLEEITLRDYGRVESALQQRIREGRK